VEVRVYLVLAMVPHLQSNSKGVLYVIGGGDNVGMATRNGLDVPGFKPLWGRAFPFLFRRAPRPHPACCSKGTGIFSRTSRLAMVHPDSYSVDTGVLCRAWSGRGVLLTTHVHLMQWLMSRAIPLLALYAVMALTGGKPYLQECSLRDMRQQNFVF
jgi:hypothetical protein